MGPGTGLGICGFLGELRSVVRPKEGIPSDGTPASEPCPRVSLGPASQGQMVPESH